MFNAMFWRKLSNVLKHVMLKLWMH